MEQESLLALLALSSQQPHIWISKSQYRLELRLDTLLLARFPVVFGGNPVDDKLRQGDRCTPEGTFQLRDLYPHQKWSKFLWIDYPTEASWQKHRTAKAQGLIPEEADIGGEIGIHGVPEGYDYAIDQRQNWTLGCISLKNEDVDWLYQFAFKGMKVIISP
ncbi:MAG: L,D-transpeptidase [Bacteroidota bacterium]